MFSQFLAQSSSGGSTLPLIVTLVITLIAIVGWWKLFSKAGYPGFLALIPLVNVVVYIMVGGRPWWWIILMLIPFINIIILFLVHLSVAERYGQGVLYAFGLFFLMPVFAIILGFGPFEYREA